LEAMLGMETGQLENNETSWYFQAMHIAYKIWIEVGNMYVFGVGLYQILSLVRQKGSLKKAAEELKMSYRAAWGKVRGCENRMGVILLEQGRHGRHGAHLTNEGEALVDHFQKILNELYNHSKTDPIAKSLREIKDLPHND
jgi:molybdate transport system regulatory protein